MNQIINLYDPKNREDKVTRLRYISLLLYIDFNNGKLNTMYKPQYLMDMALYNYMNVKKTIYIPTENVIKYIKNWLEFNETNFLIDYNKNITIKKLKNFIKRYNIFTDYELSIEHNEEEKSSILKLYIKKFSFTFNNDLILQKLLFSLFHYYATSVWENKSQKSKFELILPYKYNTTTILSKQYMKNFRTIFKYYSALFTEVKFNYDNKFVKTISNKATDLLSLLELSCWKNCGVNSEDTIQTLKFIDSVIKTWRKKSKFTPNEAALVIQKFYKTNIVLYKESLAEKMTNKRRRASSILDIKNSRLSEIVKKYE